VPIAPDLPVVVRVPDDLLHARITGDSGEHLVSLRHECWIVGAKRRAGEHHQQRVGAVAEPLLQEIARLCCLGLIIGESADLEGMFQVEQRRDAHQEEQRPDGNHGPGMPGAPTAKLLKQPNNASATTCIPWSQYTGRRKQVCRRACP